jgi:hypothetical protein
VSNDEISITVAQAKRRRAAKMRTRSAHGKETKSDPTLTESDRRIVEHRLQARPYFAARLRRARPLRADACGL